jgi:hypothetical protein
VEYVGELVSVQERNVQAMAEFGAKLEAALVHAQGEQQIELPVSAGEAALALRCLFDGVIQSWLLSRGGFAWQWACAPWMRTCGVWGLPWLRDAALTAWESHATIAGLRR